MVRMVRMVRSLADRTFQLCHWRHPHVRRPSHRRHLEHAERRRRMRYLEARSNQGWVTWVENYICDPNFAVLVLGCIEADFLRKDYRWKALDEIYLHPFVLLPSQNSSFFFHAQIFQRKISNALHFKPMFTAMFADFDESLSRHSEVQNMTMIIGKQMKIVWFSEMSPAQSGIGDKQKIMPELFMIMISFLNLLYWINCFDFL